MIPTLADVVRAVEDAWPPSGAADWDSSGLVSGDLRRPVRRIHLAVDAVRATVDEALAVDADLLLVHHPLLLRGVTSVAETGYKGALLADLIRGGCALHAAHTTADVVEDGTSGRLAALLGLVPETVRPLEPAERGVRGIGRVGDLPAPTTLGRLAGELARVLPPTATGIRVSGPYDAPVTRVALCGGAGDSLLGSAGVTGADVYVTSDLRHHPASEARESAILRGGAPYLVDTSHWASEWLWLDQAADTLRSALPDVEVTVSDIRTDPWDFVVTQ
ncbi:Nif3-like dinuclear metal center hexameric protein [Clavibacter michiganensis]|uniref:Nif3-like dinuclear metal center hexameric protein n=1 Tax=Clavibacter michiganensis TaxID=28447 RepID=UPI000CE8155C|nr:Nif3-like dinuclear metal center hexameric protein [Clavibacter michiganensis]PPF57324.1 Nif3-like dinuclear metal center hexameric protein [Clavibacter michiganensis]